MKNKNDKLNGPTKKSDKELYELLTRKILSGEYVFKSIHIKDKKIEE